MTDNTTELEQLRKFYRAVALLASRHEDIEGFPVVNALDLIRLLHLVDPDWNNKL